MAKALLINPSYARTYGSNEGGLAFPVYPVLNLAALGGAVKARGHEVEILDLSYRIYDADMVAEQIARARPDLIGITATTPLANQMRDISFLVKDRFPDIVTIGGGAHPTAMPMETMRESVLDHIASGEADWTVADLLDGKRPEEVPGLWWRDGDDVRSTPGSALVEDLDSLPMPAWAEYPLESNSRVTRLVVRQRPVTTIEFSRGCIYTCDFCGSKNTMGRGYRKKSPERCAEELAYLQSLGYREVTLVDDIFTTDNDWAAAVCEEIIRRDITMGWTCNNGIRVDSANTELFTLMKRAGCYRVYFGFESGNEEVLKAFGKGGRASLEKGIDAVEMARESGLEPNGFFMVGLSGDTEESMQDTIDYARTVRLDTMKCGMCVPYPGTPMFRDLQREGKIKTFDWDAYTVYNNAENIFDHPTLPWSTITDYFQKFYREAYLKNPKYLWRRAVFMVRNGEIFWNIYYTFKFWLMLFGKPKVRETERYGYEDRWRPLDTKPDASVSEVVVPIVRRKGTAFTRKRAAAS